MQLSHKLAPHVEQLNSSLWRISFLHSPHSMVPLTNWNMNARPIRINTKWLFCDCGLSRSLQTKQ